MDPWSPLIFGLPYIDAGKLIDWNEVPVEMDKCLVHKQNIFRILKGKVCSTLFNS